MSFSINARAATKDDVREAISEKLDSVVAQQEIHKADRTLAEDTALAALDMLDELPEPADGEEPTHDYSLTITGSLGWNYVEGETPDKFTSVSVTVHAGILSRTN